MIPLAKGVEVKARGRRGWVRLHSPTAKGEGWWAWERGKHFVPIRDTDITAARPRSDDE